MPSFYSAARRALPGALLLLTVAMPAQAEVYEIFPTGMTSSCNEEFENVANALQPGDELILHDGVYAQGCGRVLDINGTPSQPILIRAANGASPLITRPADTGCCHNNIELKGSYYTIRGLRFQHGSAGVRFLSSNNITFEANEIFDTLNNALTMNSGSTDSHILRNNHIHHAGLDTNGTTEGEGMYIGCHSGNCVASNHLIEGNHIHHLRSTSGGGNDGIEIKYRSYGNVVRNNLIHDTNIGTEYPCVFVYGHGDGPPNVVEGNLMFNCGEAVLVTADAVIRNNLILSSSSHGIHARQQNPAPSIKNVWIVNNTIYGTHPTCVQLRWAAASNVVFANNAVFCEGSTAMNVSGAGNALISSNYVRGSMVGVSTDSLQFVGAPAASTVFEDPFNFNFALRDGAPLVDAGDTNVPYLPAVDYAGMNRISGLSVDVGALEFTDGLDSDGDGVADAVDNCVSLVNPAQRDTDADGFGNRCDPDFNNDGVVNAVDLGYLRSVFFGTDADADLNGDGLVNAIDLGILRSFFFGNPG